MTTTATYLFVPYRDRIYFMTFIVGCYPTLFNLSLSGTNRHRSYKPLSSAAGHSPKKVTDPARCSFPKRSARPVKRARESVDSNNAEV
jgi:hypothetical protein